MALLFGGAASDRVDHGSGSTLDDLASGGALTTFAWVYRTGDGANQEIITKDNSYPNGFDFIVDNGGGEGELRFVLFRGTTSTDWTDVISAPGAVPLNTWTFVAGTYDSTLGAGVKAKLYVGSLVTPAAELSYSLRQDGSGAASSDAGANLYVGNVQRTNAHSFKGRIQRGGVAAAGLTREQLQVAQYGTLAQQARLPDVRLLFDYHDTGTQPDHSGNGNTGSVTGATVADGPGLWVAAPVLFVPRQVTLSVPQKVYPTADVMSDWIKSSDGTNSNVYTMLDEGATYDDTDYVRSPTSASAAGFIVALGDPTDPNDDTGHVLRYRYRKEAAGNPVAVTVRLTQGGTEIGVNVHSDIPTTWTPGSIVIGEAEAATITDYTDLRAVGLATETAPAAPTLVGMSPTLANTATNGAAMAVSWPTGYTVTANDISVVVAQTNSNVAFTAPTGYTAYAPGGVAENNTTAQRVQMWYRRLQAGDSAPSVPGIASNTVRSAFLFIVRGAITSGDPFDTSARTNGGSPSLTPAVPQVSVNTGSTLSVAVVAYEDNITALSQMTGWSTFTVINTATGTDQAMGLASKTNASAGIVNGGSTTRTGAADDIYVSLHLTFNRGSVPARANISWFELEVPASATPPEEKTSSDALTVSETATVNVITSEQYTQGQSTQLVANIDTDDGTFNQAQSVSISVGTSLVVTSTENPPVITPTVTDTVTQGQTAPVTSPVVADSLTQAQPTLIITVELTHQIGAVTESESTTESATKEDSDVFNTIDQANLIILTQTDAVTQDQTTQLVANIDTDDPGYVQSQTAHLITVSVDHQIGTVTESQSITESATKNSSDTATLNELATVVTVTTAETITQSDQTSTELSVVDQLATLTETESATQGTVEKTGNDSAALAETVSITLITTEASYSLTEAAPTVALAPIDSVAQSQTLTITLTNLNDSVTQAQTVSITVTRSDAFTETETSSLSATITGTDSTAQGQTLVINPSAIDQITVTDSGTISTTHNQSDSSTQSQTVNIIVNRTDSATQNQTVGLTGYLTATDQAAVSEGQSAGESVDNVASSSQSITMAESASITAFINQTDPASITETITSIGISGPTDTGTQTQTVTTTLTRTDNATQAQTASTQLSAQDQATENDGASVSATIAGTDSASSIQLSTVFGFVGNTDTATLGQTANTANFLVTTDSAAVGQQQTLNAIIAQTEPYVSTEESRQAIFASDQATDAATLLFALVQNDLVNLSEAEFIDISAAPIVSVGLLSMTEAIRYQLVAADSLGTSLEVTDQESALLTVKEFD
jgi:hypothetical protein